MIALIFTPSGINGRAGTFAYSRNCHADLFVSFSSSRLHSIFDWLRRLAVRLWAILGKFSKLSFPNQPAVCLSIEATSQLVRAGLSPSLVHARVQAQAWDLLCMRCG